MADMNPPGEGTDASAPIRPAPVDLNAPDAQAALAFLVSKGWAPEEVELLLNKHAAADTTDRPVEEHLLSLGWSKSDVARLLVGPEKSHLTAEALFRQHAANSDADQQVLLTALVQAGAKNVKPDPKLLSGLDEKHLSPEKPIDLEQLISQFAMLPDVQQQRFLLLLDSQKLGKRTLTASPANTGELSKLISPGAGGGAAKTSGSAGDALPVVKSGLDLLNTALKGLLGATKTSRKNVGGSPKGSLFQDSSVGESDSDDSLGPPEDDRSGEQGGGSTDDIPSTSDEGSSPGELGDSLGPDYATAPD